MALDKKVGLQENCPIECLPDQKGSESSEKLFQGIATNALEKICVALSCLFLSHKVDFDALNWTQESGFQYCNWYAGQ